MKVSKNGNSVVVNQKLIKLGESGNGGWNKKQLAILGIDWPPQKGWRNRVEGTVISNEDAIRFVSLKKKAKDGDTIKKKIKENGEPLFIKVDKNLSLEEQYKHPNWQKLRLIILQRDKFSCRVCGDNQSQLHVHHLKYDGNKKIWGVKHSDLVTLCEKCHLNAHGRKKFSKWKNQKQLN